LEWVERRALLLEVAYAALMSTVPNLRRSTRVPIKVAIEVESSTEPLKCEGVTVVVSLHGALISTTIPLAVGMKITLYVIITDKRAKGRVVYVDPESPLRCGVELDQPGNIWGVSLHPEDWDAKRT
jgi:PilZ domain-containing protein